MVRVYAGVNTGVGNQVQGESQRMIRSVDSFCSKLMVLTGFIEGAYTYAHAHILRDTGSNHNPRSSKLCWTLDPCKSHDTIGVGVRSQVLHSIMANYDGETRKDLQQKKLQKVILRAVFNGHIDPVRDAIEVLSKYFGEDLPHDGKQLLDFFPEKDRYSLVSVTYKLGQSDSGACRNSDMVF